MSERLGDARVLARSRKAIRLKGVNHESRRVAGAHQQVIALRDARRACSSLAIERDRGLPLTGTLQQMSTYRGQPMTARKPLVLVERFEQRQSGTRTFDHRSRDCMIELHDGIVGHPSQHAVEREDLRPVRVLGARRLIVQRCDSRQQLILADRSARQGSADERDAFGDRLLVPQRSILLVERDQLAERSGARRAARVGQQHEREQTCDLRIVRQQHANRTREADRFVRQVRAMQARSGAGRVAFVENEIENVQHRAQALRSFLGVRHAERHLRRLDALLRAADPLRHRGFGNQERLGDLRRRQAPDGAQRERDCRCR